MSNKRLYTAALLVGVASFLTYYFLSCKEYTWLFTSGDSGDWLAASTWWIVPQPYGSPLFISLGHLVNLLPGSLVTNMTVLLSVLPSAITISLVFLIVAKATQKMLPAILSAVVLLGSAVFLSQSTVLEEYALAVMFVTLAIYLYQLGHKKLVALSLGLGTAVHILVLPISVLWLALHLKQWKSWVVPSLVYIASGVLPYTLILWLMATDAPRLLAGGLSWGALNAYLGSTGVVGTLSVVDTPVRLLSMAEFLLVSLGLGIIPVVLAIRDEAKNKLGQMLIVLACFSIWYALTCIDPTTWTFLVWGAPALAILAGLGVRHLGAVFRTAVLTGAIVLVLVNGVFLNAGKLNNEDPVARNLYQSIWQLPDGVALVMDRGGFESMGVYYAMSQGKDIIPLFYCEPDHRDTALYQFYLEWVEGKYGVQGETVDEQVRYLLGIGATVYTAKPDPTLPDTLNPWKPTLLLQETNNPKFAEVTGIESNEDENKEDEDKSD